MEKAYILVFGVAALLAVSGYSSVEAEEPQQLSQRYVTVSFDDGYSTQVEAAEMLERRGMTGSFFVNGENIGGTFENKSVMNRSELLDLSEAHEVGDHTFSHINMSEVNSSVARRDIERNRQYLQQRGIDADVFRYPYNEIGSQETVNRYYDYAATGEWGINDLEEMDTQSLKTVSITEENYGVFDDHLERMEKGEWMIVTLHSVEENVTRENIDISRQKYREMLETLEGSDVEIVTFEQMKRLRQDG